MTEELEFYRVADRINNAPAPVGVVPSTTRGQLRRTHGLLESLHLSAHAEMEENGWDTELFVNPINALLYPERTRPFFNNLTNAIRRGSRQRAFEPREANATPQRDLLVGDRVRTTRAVLGNPYGLDDHLAVPGIQGTVTATDAGGSTPISVNVDENGEWYFSREQLELIP